MAVVYHSEKPRLIARKSSGSGWNIYGGIFEELDMQAAVAPSIDVFRTWNAGQLYEIRFV